MLYRQHRGSFNESMETVITVNSLDELVSHLNSDMMFFITKQSIKFKNIGIDKRNGWKTYMVFTDDMVAGYTNGILV